MNVNTSSLTLLLLVSVSLMRVSAETVFTQDFESLSAGDTTYFNVTIADENTGTPFGGPENQYGVINTSQSFLRYDNLNLSPDVLTYRFDLYDSSTAASGAVPVTIGFGTGDVNGTKTYNAWEFHDGTLTLDSHTNPVSGSLPGYLEDRVYTVFMLYNKSGANQAISGSSTILAAGETALFLYDTVTSTLLDGGVYSSDNATYPAPTSFLIRNFSSGTNELYVDNLIQDDTLMVIPEPASLLLFALGGLTLLGFRGSRSRPRILSWR